MRAIRLLALTAQVMLKHLMRTMLPALALTLVLAFASAPSWAQKHVPDATPVQLPSDPSLRPPPPEDPDPPPSLYDAATGVSISAPTSMTTGSTAYVTVTIRNSGTTT